jgi:5-methyltetrahydropteroyltriglutamate--homocysteine methyltransferase
MKRSEHQILTTHTGSLPRAAALMDILGRNERGEGVDPTDLYASVEPAIQETVRRQVESGITVINDGEQSKTNFSSYHYHRLTGFSHLPALPSKKIHPCQAEAVDFPDFFLNRWGPIARPPGEKFKMPAADLCCTGQLGWKDFSEVERDVANLKAATRGLDVADVFMTAISPGTYLPRNEHYASEDQYLNDMADVMAREYKAIVDAGIVLQIDAPDLTVYYRMEEVTVEQHLAYMGRRIDAINYATRDLPTDMVRVHACWGADEAPHHRDIPLELIVHELLRLRPAGLMVPGANGRHSHEWRVWGQVKLPADKVLFPGVIDSTTNIIEHPQAVADRILSYASVVGRERVIAGVDCGLAYIVDPPIVWAKLRSLSEGAAIASRELWAKAA